VTRRGGLQFRREPSFVSTKKQEKKGSYPGREEQRKKRKKKKGDKVRQVHRINYSLRVREKKTHCELVCAALSQQQLIIIKNIICSTDPRNGSGR